MKQFDYTLDYAHLDLRERPELYTVGRGEQGVLLVEPYKSGCKYSQKDGAVLPDRHDPVKAQAAAVFKVKWDQARADPEYEAMKVRHREKYEQPPDA